jgi:hypothetical protein
MKHPLFLSEGYMNTKTKCTDMYYHSLAYVLQCIGVHEICDNNICTLKKARILKIFTTSVCVPFRFHPS